MRSQHTQVCVDTNCWGSAGYADDEMCVMCTVCVPIVCVQIASAGMYLLPLGALLKDTTAVDVEGGEDAVHSPSPPTSDLSVSNPTMFRAQTSWPQKKGLFLQHLSTSGKKAFDLCLPGI